MHDRKHNEVKYILIGIMEGLIFKRMKFLLAILKGSITIARMKTLSVCT